MSYDCQQNWNFYLGDHFQYWNGASIDDSAKSVSETTRKSYYKELERIFHSYNICGRIVSHYVNALVGKPFTLSLKNSDGSDSEIPIEVSNLIQRWLEWQSKSNIKKGSDRGSAIAEAITQMLATGTGYLRLYRPKRFQNLADPYKRIVLHCPKRGSVETKRDEDEILYWAQYSYGDSKKETYELLDNGLTRITSAEGSSADVDYQGSLPVFELNGRCLITQDLKQIQKAINKLLTMWDKNLEYAGFPERVILNGQPPGHWEVDKTTGDRQFIPNPSLMELGADKIAFIPGIPVGDTKSPTNYTRAEMFYRDPVDVENFVKSLDSYKANGYEVSGLGHLLAQGGDRISGKSRLAGKEDYVADLGNYERIVEATIVEIFTVVSLFLNKDYSRLLGGKLTTQNATLNDYTPVVDLNLSITSPPEEREQNRLDYQAGAMSLPTLITARGQDSNPEINLIEADKKRQLEMLVENPDFTNGKF